MLQQNLFAGFGGQGMLLIGQFLAEAGMLEGKHVSWLPSYGPEMRGGTANCSVCVSDREISSPVITSPTCVIAMNRPSLEKFAPTVRPGGLLIINSSIIDIKCERDDIEIIYIPANTLAQELGSAQAANVVILGAFLEKSRAVSFESMEQAMRIKFGEKKAHLLEMNARALRVGADFVKGKQQDA